nr:signal recognition particle subunit SRP72 [Onthophagus taurus]
MSGDKSAKEKSITQGYTELYRLEQNGDYDRALKIANKILHASPNEATAFHCKVVCLIQSSKFDEAINCMKKHPNLSENLQFEKAYCLYRSNKCTEALKVIEEVEEVDFCLSELRAQIYYRIEMFDNAVAEYENIIKSTDDDYVNERETNMNAALAYMGGNFNTSDTSVEETYELCYNKACRLLQQGYYLEAEKKLKHCEKLCREALEEDGATEDEIQIELAHVKIQLAFVYQKVGRIKEAQGLYVHSLKLKLEDPALAAVACNNAVVINRDQNVFDSKKKMKVATNDQLAFKLLSSQRKNIAFNNALLLYYTNQLDQCRKACENIEATWPELKVKTAIIKTIIAVKNNQLEKAMAILEKCQTTNDDDALFLALCRAQLWLMEGNRQKACEIFLKDIGTNRYKPGIVGALITLYLAEGKEEVAQNIYKDTVEWYKMNKKQESDLTNLWRQAAEFHIRNGQAAVAAGSLEELLRSNPNDKKTIAQLVIAYGEFDPLKAIKLGSKLYKLEEIVEGLDTDSVESSAWLSTKKSAVSKSGENSPGSTPSTPLLDGQNGVSKKKRKSHKKKGKLPKNYDPKVPPNPERWLPKYERTGYRKKRDRRVKDVIKGSQGTASGQAELFDFSSKSAGDVEVDTSSSVEPSPATRNQPKKNQQKKKNRRR